MHQTNSTTYFSMHVKMASCSAVPGSSVMVKSLCRPILALLLHRQTQKELHKIPHLLPPLHLHPPPHHHHLQIQ